MLEIKIENKADESAFAMSVFKQIFGALEDIITTITVRFSKENMKIQVIDSMHVCLCVVDIVTSVFTHYRCDKDIVLTIPLKIFNTIMKNCSLSGDKSSFMLSAMESSSREIEVENAGNDGEGKKEEVSTANKLNLCNEIDGSISKFSIDLLESELPQYTAPMANWSSIINVRSDGFKLFKNYGDLFGSKIIFRVQKNEFILEQHGEGTSSDVVLKADDENKPYTIDSTSPCSIEIKKSYLNNIGKLFSMSEEMQISMMEEHPILFELKLFNFGYVQFFIAPQS
ncbi:Proliferating [Ecytonucleospora hepatopenaei]|uniref:DNA sliding clamp PCNA n=1 Tax=Ecytonucleospora hepatopenaei TaxID=646526 RepID=A0A1W0E7P2_9MICR|nr:Proliferating [Ecytonucleospora hepatopenaei]